MLRKLLGLTVLVVLGASALLWRMDRVSAQIPPCVPISPLSTLCAPLERVVTICPDQLAPFVNPALAYGYWQGMPVSFYGQTFYYNAAYAPAFYYGTPYMLRLHVSAPTQSQPYGTITLVEQLTDRPCTQAFAAPTPIPTVAPTIVYRTVEVAKPQTFEAVKAGVAAISPPRTGDAGLKAD